MELKLCYVYKVTYPTFIMRSRRIDRQPAFTSNNRFSSLRGVIRNAGWQCLHPAKPLRSLLITETRPVAPHLYTKHLYAVHRQPIGGRLIAALVWVPPTFIIRLTDDFGNSCTELQLWA